MDYTVLFQRRSVPVQGRRGWDWVIFKVCSNPNPSVILSDADGLAAHPHSTAERILCLAAWSWSSHPRFKSQVQPSQLLSCWVSGLLGGWLGKAVSCWASGQGGGLAGRWMEAWVAHGAQHPGASCQPHVCLANRAGNCALN